MSSSIGKPAKASLGFQVQQERPNEGCERRLLNENGSNTNRRRIVSNTNQEETSNPGIKRPRPTLIESATMKSEEDEEQGLLPQQNYIDVQQSLEDQYPKRHVARRRLTAEHVTQHEIQESRRRSSLVDPDLTSYNYPPAPTTATPTSTLAIGNRTPREMRHRKSFVENFQAAQKWATQQLVTRGSIWTGSVVEEDDKDEDYGDTDTGRNSVASQARESLTFYKACGICLRGMWYEMNNNFKLMREHPKIIGVSMLVFILLCTSGVLTVMLLYDTYVDQMNDKAHLMASEAVSWFASQWSQAMLPLFSLQQAIELTPSFHVLSQQVGPYNQTNYGTERTFSKIVSGVNRDVNYIPRQPRISTDMVSQGHHSNTFVYRNVTSICDNLILQSQFSAISTSIKNRYELNGIALSYRLAPHNVICMAEPQVNHEDFARGIVLDNRLLVGLDLENSKLVDDSFLQDPFQTGALQEWQIAIQAISTMQPHEASQKVTIYGPVPLHSLTGDVLIAEALYGHLPVYIANDTSNQEYWGMIEVVLDWGRLKESSGIYKRFQKQGLEFLLTKTNQFIDPLTNLSKTETISVAASSQYHVLTNQTMSSATIQTHDGEWTLNAGYTDGYDNTFYLWGIVSAVWGSAIVAMLVSLLLVERKFHKNILYKVLPKRAIAKLSRGQTVVEKYKQVTIFFSDIIGFTSMAGEMTPIQVMKMLNELYSEFDKIVAKHGVYKVETIGDAYMVVGGAPNRLSCPEAAERVTLFALDVIDCVKTFKTSGGVTVAVRAGLASGPVVAGVVGNTMPRYCFFGDTVNFASRMESTSVKMRIQCCDLTHRMLMQAPTHDFQCLERQENGVAGVEMKGKGLVHTWWIKRAKKRTLDSMDRTCTSMGEDEFVTEIEVSPSARPGARTFLHRIASTATLGSFDLEEDIHHQHECREEQALFRLLSRAPWLHLGKIELTRFNIHFSRAQLVQKMTALLMGRLTLLVKARASKPAVSMEARKELVSYIWRMASMFDDLPYHSLEHAVFLATSANKLIADKTNSTSLDNVEDCLINFGIVFSAFVRDVGHTGMSNEMLSDNDHEIAQQYKHDSPAERFAFETAVGTLFQDEFDILRHWLLPTMEDRILFGKVVFTSIVCTDMDSVERQRMVKMRYEAAEDAGGCMVGGQSSTEGRVAAVREQVSGRVIYNAKMCPASLYLEDIFRLISLDEEFVEQHRREFVIDQAIIKRCALMEHLIQVADLSHTMQDWQTFLTWNFRLFRELKTFGSAFRPVPEDISVNWAKEQSVIFELYVLPLASRAHQCAGLQSCDLVQYACANKERWDIYGGKISSIFLEFVTNFDQEKEVIKRCLELLEND